MKACSRVTVYVLFGLYSSLGTPVDVDIALSSRTTSCDLPEKLTVSLKTSSEKVVLNLDKVDDVKEDAPLFVLRHQGRGNSVVTAETSPRINSEVTSEYQDEAYMAAMVVSCRMNDDTRQLSLEGSLLLSDGKQYLLFKNSDPDGSYTLEAQENTDSIGELADFVIDPENPLADIDISTSRVTLPDVYIDVVTLVDYAVYNKWLSRSGSRNEALANIKRYFAHMMNAFNVFISVVEEQEELAILLKTYVPSIENKPWSEINLRYKTVSPHIHMALAGYVIEDQGPGQWFERVRQSDSFYQTNTIDGQRLLDSVRQMTRTVSGFPTNDHVLTFTAYDIRTAGSSGNYDLLGIAYMQSVCQQGGRSVSVVQYNDRFTDDMLVATHEIGHGMSANHDGTNNMCRATDKFIMAPSYDGNHNLYNNNPHYFSSCSIQYIKSYINYLLQNRASERCLMTSLRSPTVPDVSDELPGQYYDVNEQCRQINGPQSYYCREPVSASICKRMPCYRPSWRTCTRHAAVDGTTCGQNRWCRLGSCVTAPVNPTNPPSCSLKCQNGGTLNRRTCSCTCVGSFSGNTCESCSKRCPQGQRLNTQQCTCITVNPTCRRRCHNGGTLDTRTCTCDCSESFSGRSCETCSRTCTQGQRLDTRKCTCITVTSACSRRCLNGGKINPNTCTCNCVGNYRGRNCETCSRTCPLGQQLSDRQCTCVPVRTCRQTCWNGGVLNTETCSCNCAGNYYGNSCEFCSRRCPRGHQMKRGQCRCIPANCYYRDPSGCSSVVRFNRCSAYYMRCPWTCGRCCKYTKLQNRA